MHYQMVMVATLALGAYAAPARPQITNAPRAADVVKRQGGGSSVLKAPMTIAAGESFDGGNAIFDRGVSCTGQKEGGDSDAVFILEAGASLSNVRIGPNQVEGVHCMGGCTITNVVWDAVCEDAFTIKKQEAGQTTTINGGSAKGAKDKVIQHNGGGTVVVNDFEVSDFGKAYRSCGNCAEMPARHVKWTGGSATSGKVLVGINENMGDTATISGVKLSGVKSECTNFKGVSKGNEPSEVGPCSGTSGGGGSDGGSDDATPTTPAAGTPSTTEAPSGGDDSDSGDDSGSPTTSADPEPTSTKTPSGGDDSDSGDDSGSGSPTTSADAEPTSTEAPSGDDDSGSDGDSGDSDDSSDDKKDKKKKEKNSKDKKTKEACA